MIMKKIIAILLIAAMAASFAACGSKTENTTTAAVQTTAGDAATTTPATEAPVSALPTVALDDGLVNLGKLTALNQETPFVINSLLLGTVNKINSDTFYLGEEIRFTLDCELPESEYTKVKVYCAPYEAGAKAVPAKYAFVSDYAAAAEEGGVNFVNSVAVENGAGYYNLFFVYGDTVAYRMAIKLIEK